MNNELCPCGTGKPYKLCCGKFHLGKSYPKTALDLMRSRYTAFCKGEISYLTQTSYPLKKGKDEEKDLQNSIEQFQWYELEIIREFMGKIKDKKGKIEFKARYIHNGTSFVHHEISLFRKINGKWFYLNSCKD